MRIAILFIAALLAGCNSSDDDSALQQQISAVPNEATAVQAMRAQISDLQFQISKFKELQLIGNPLITKTDSVRAMAMLREPIAAPSAGTTNGQFGPCSDMGVMIGFTNQDGAPAEAVSATGQDWKQCTGYYYSTNISGGTIGTAPRLFWDGPNCTGNMYEWESAGAGFNTQSLKAGIVFSSPLDGSVLMVTAGQIPQPIFYQSVMTRQDPICQIDQETQLVYKVEPNDVSISGVPSNGVGSYQLISP